MKILITGANRGLGLALSSECLARGHEVALGCRRQNADTDALLARYPQKALALPLDVGDEAGVQRAANTLQSAWGELDAIINNAAVLLESKYATEDIVTELPLATYEKTLDINVMGPLRVMHFFMPLVYRSQTPALLNITSEGAMLKPLGHHYPSYAISKYALNMATQKARNYYKEAKPQWPLRIYMIHPGRMNTVMGTENAQIEPQVPAVGIADILEGKTAIPDMDIPFIDYNGHPMPDHYTP